MNNLQTKVRTLSNAGIISLDSMLPVAAAADQEQAETLDLLRRCKSWVGMDLGEEISAKISAAEGKKFSSVDYNFEKQPGEQGI